MTNTITMIDYGASNIRSAFKAFEYVGAQVTLTGDPDIVRRATKLVLPGVGAFGSGMGALRAAGLEAPIHEAVQRGIPLLGICAGMQFLFDSSDEMGIHQGLGLIPGHVTRFPDQLRLQEEARPLKIPHMGWNQLEIAVPHPLLQDVPASGYGYFVHSYYCSPSDPTHVLAWSDYGMPFAAIVARDNVLGIQFHPEKSQHIGLQIIRNYVERC